MPTQRQENAALMLLDAIARQDVTKLAATLMVGADPNSTDVQAGVYPLHAATHVGRLDMVQLLLHHGADVDSRNLEGHAALQMACITGHVDILLELLEAGADPDMTDVNGRNPMHFMARQGSIQALRELIQAGAQIDAKDDVGYAPIHHAAVQGNLPALRALVRAGSSHTWRSNTMETPLAAACMAGQTGSVKYLFEECKADPGAIDSEGHTTLALAAHNGHLAVVKLMLGFGVRQLGPRAYPDTLIGMAMSGDVCILRELIRAEGGVHVNNAKTPVHMTPLHFSAAFCHVVATRMLLEAGADETVLDLKGQTPLDAVGSMRSGRVALGLVCGDSPNGNERQQVTLMLTQAPAYRARSWRWPTVVARSPAAPAKSAPASTKNVAESTTTAEACLAAGATETAEKSAKEVDRTVDAGVVAAAAPARTGMAGFRMYRRPATSSSGSTADGDSAVVASLIRYARKN